MKRLIRVLTALLLLSCLLVLPAAALGEEQSYSFSYDLESNPMPGPAPFETRYRIDPAEFGAGKLKNAGGLYVRGDLAYICDTGNSRILVLHLGNHGAQLEREIKSGDGWSLSAPEDVFVDESGNFFICDTGNGRVLCLDAALRLRMSIGKPDSALFDQSADFKPEKAVCAAGGRIYVQAMGVNRGLIEFSADGEFQGYMGASPVRFDWTDYIWKILSTDAQKQQMESFVPTEYNNISVDPEGFLFVTNSVFSIHDLLSGAAQPVRRLNLKGSNILNCDLQGMENWNESGPSRFIDVAVPENKIIYLLDSRYCRIFAYDSMGNMLYAFGGYGNRTGWFQNPTALESWGEDLLVLDATSGYLTVLTPTRYGRLVTDAICCYDSGRYEESYAAWQEVLRLNGNCYLAYDGIGKIKLRNGDYEGALADLKYAKDRYYYSKAYQLYRKQWLEDHLLWIVLVILSIVVIRVVYKWLRKQKEALEEYES